LVEDISDSDVLIINHRRISQNDLLTKRMDQT